MQTSVFRPLPCEYVQGLTTSSVFYDLDVYNFNFTVMSSICLSKSNRRFHIRLYSTCMRRHLRSSKLNLWAAAKHYLEFVVLSRRKRKKGGEEASEASVPVYIGPFVKLKWSERRWIVSQTQTEGQECEPLQQQFTQRWTRPGQLLYLIPVQHTLERIHTYILVNVFLLREECNFAALTVPEYCLK